MKGRNKLSRIIQGKNILEGNLVPMQNFKKKIDTYHQQRWQISPKNCTIYCCL
jgi:hypothetical protein